MKIGYALITDNPVFSRVIGVENRIHGQSGFADYLGEEKNLPHTTIFQGDLSEDMDYREVAGKIADKFAELFPRKTIVFEKVEYIPEGWYFWMCKKDRAFQRLHDYTLELVKPYILLDPMRMEKIKEEMPRIQREAIRQYGYRYAGEAFSPHITIGRSQGKDVKLLEKLNEQLGDGETRAAISRVTVYKMGNNGTHSETLYEINL